MMLHLNTEYTICDETTKDTAFKSLIQNTQYVAEQKKDTPYKSLIPKWLCAPIWKKSSLIIHNCKVDDMFIVELEQLLSYSLLFSYNEWEFCSSFPDLLM